MKIFPAALALALAVPASALADSASPLDLHDGYWVTKVKPDSQQVAMTVINDMHVDAETMKITVFAQARVMGRVVSPPQVEAGECHETREGQTQCQHPNAVYLNGSGKRLTASDGTGAWWVEHSWVLGGAGYDNTELMPPLESYESLYVEGVLLADGLTMRVGNPDWYNLRTPLVGGDAVSYRVTRYDMTGLFGAEGDSASLTAVPQFDLIWDCRDEKSAFDGAARGCPSAER